MCSQKIDVDTYTEMIYWQRRCQLVEDLLFEILKNKKIKELYPLIWFKNMPQGK